MTLWKVGKGWRYSFKYQKSRYSSRIYPSKTEAAAELADHKKAIKKASIIKEKIGLTFSELAGSYLEWSELRHVTKTHEYKKMVCRSLISHTGDIPLGTHRVLISSIEDYLKTRPSNHNYNIHRKELRAVFNYGIEKKIIPGPNPISEIDKLPEDQTVKYIPSQKDIIKVILAAGDDRPLILVLLHTLARIGEVLGMRWQDVNFSQNSVRLWTRKRKGGGLEYDDLPMNPDLKEVLQDLWSTF